MRKILGSLSLAAAAALSGTSATAGEVAWSISMAAPGAAVTIGVPGLAVGPVYYPAPQVVYPAPVYSVGYAPRIVYPAPVATWGVPAYRVVLPPRVYGRGWGHAAPVVVAPYGHWHGHRRHHHHHRH